MQAIYQNSHSQTTMESVWSVSKLSTESVGIRRKRRAICELCSYRRRDAARQFRRVNGVYWALQYVFW